MPRLANDKTEEQVVEYTEEQGEPIKHEAPSLSPSAGHQPGIQRKRGLVEDEALAQYEEDDHEAEIKRVKVD